MLALFLTGYCLTVGGLACLAIAKDDKKYDGSYRDGKYDPWIDDPTY